MSAPDRRTPQDMPAPWRITESGAVQIAGPGGSMTISQGLVSWKTTGGRGEVPSGQISSLNVALPRMRPWVRRVLMPLYLLVPQAIMGEADITVSIDAGWDNHSFSLGVPDRPFGQRASTSINIMFIALDEERLVSRIGEVDSLIQYIYEVDRVIKPWLPDFSLRPVRRAARACFA